MNILHVNMSMDPITGGGTAQRTGALITYLNKLNNTNAKVITTDIGLNNKVFKHDQNTMVVLPCLIKRWYIPTFNYKKIYETVEWADVIHLMNHWTVLNIWVYLIAKKQGKPYVVCPAGSLEIFGRSKIFKLIYNYVIGYRMLKNASRIIAITKPEMQYFHTINANKHVEFIPNGVDCNVSFEDERTFNKIFNIPDKPYILFVGRLNLIKGPDLLINAFIKINKKYPDINLVLAGPDDGMGQDLKKIIDKNNLENRVFLTGYIGGDDKKLAYRDCSFLVIPSRKEAMSLVALEAAVYNKPVLMTNACGFPELVEAGGGIEVSPTIESIAYGISNLLELNNNSLVEMGSKASIFVSSKYSWESISRKYIFCYESILNKDISFKSVDK